MTQDSTQKAFCGHCGTRLTAPSDSCPKCGSASSATSPTRGNGSRTAAIAIFTAFTTVAALGFYWVQRNSEPPQRAVAGSPSAPGNSSALADAGADNLPQGHPNIELPEEITTFLDDLSAKAEEEPGNVEAWIKLARARYRAALLNASYYPSAIAALERVQELEPDNPEAVRTRGNIAYDMRRFDEAQKYFERFLELQPGDSGVRTDLGSTLLFQGRTDEAKEMYRAVIADDPDYGQAHVNLAIALHRDGQPEEAKSEFTRARELATTDEQRQRIDELIAIMDGRLPPGHPPTEPGANASAPATGTPDSAAAVRDSNASSDFQKGVDEVLFTHRIVGTRIRSIAWAGDSTAVVTMADFPMDRMPPVMRNKFKSTINESIAQLADENGVGSEIDIELVDKGSGDVMDRLDGKEWVGAFDEGQYD